MSTIFNDLKKETVSVERVVLDEKIKSILGESAAYAMKMDKLIEPYSFKYSSGQHKVSGFLVAPKNITSKTPVVVFNRGGTKDLGLIKRGQLFFKPALLASWGYIIIGSQYTGNSSSEGKDERGGEDLDSVLELERLIKGLKDADTKRIGMYGQSRGGMMTYMALARVGWIKTAIVEGAPISLFESQNNRPELKEVFIEAFGGLEAELQKRSVVYWPEKLPKATSLLIIHGEKDEQVSSSSLKEFAQKLTDHQIKHKLKIYKDDDHSLLRNKAEISQLEKDWLKDYLS
ncbi:prolyl oligopeptidase family serine peptidase [Candidatus Saccharibacteria bacterium]|nr:prolyl oligopeptidase family serine peptidase [Candidatus Saccharibacteria bacterium]